METRNHFKNGVNPKNHRLGKTFNKTKMKKAILLGICVSIFLIVSCSKDDDTNLNNLSGTEWKSTVEDGFYYLLKFVGKSSYELYEFYPGDGLDKLESGSYSVDENIVILNSDDGITDRITIEGNKFIWQDLYGEDELFTKQ